jgi:succinyl-diaminopimelate desuccinylase
MERYIKLTKESFAALASKVSGRLRTSNDTLEVVPNEPEHSRHTNTMTGMLRDLVEMRTVTGAFAENNEALEYIDRYLSERGMRVKRFEWNGFGSLVATTQHTKTPKVMFVFHVDVVPGTEDLFKLREKDGKYYGRGTFDMKFAIPPLLKLIDDWQDDLHEYDFGVMVNTDEEVGGYDGVVRLVNDEGYKPLIAVVPDGGDNWKMETFSKGLWLVNLVATGKSAHGSRPWEGESATARVIDAVNAVRKLFSGTTRKDSTLTIAMMHGGAAVNQVADQAEIHLDMRFGSKKDMDVLVPKIRKICKEANIKIADTIISDPVVNKLDDPAIASFTRSIQTVTGARPGEVMSYAGADARHLAVKGIPCAIVRPPGGNLHGPGEWVDKKGFLQLIDIYKDYLQREARSTKTAPKS